MRKIWIGLLLIGYFSVNIYAQEERLGLGIVVGEPTGISVKYWTGSTIALDGALAWSFNHDGSLYLHGDFLVHDFELIDIMSGRMPVYYGFGAKLILKDDPLFGGHVPIGLAYMLEDTPLDVFIEIRPGINLFPSTRFDISGGIGVRFYVDHRKL
ncbi:MAG: hypothetical protein K9H49_07565 [Bacteroidales bacterium]|nr:hypothetical protein [Bacteroidales bacterium]MCF8404491.1 hypothetical protein [Bacteroidales bacterium]